MNASPAAAPSPLLASFALSVAQNPDGARSRYIELAEASPYRGRRAIYDMLATWTDLRHKLEASGDFETVFGPLTPGVQGGKL